MRTPEQLPHVRHSDTSAAAATKAAKSSVSRTLILQELLLKHGATGATSFDAEGELGWSHQITSSRLSQMEENALVCRNGNTRVTPSGNRAYVYYLPEFVPVEERLTVIRKGCPVFNWLEIELGIQPE